MRLRILSICLYGSFVLGACGGGTTGPVVIPDEKKTVKVDAELLKACTEPQPLASSTDKDNIAFTSKTLSSLGECSVRHKGLVEVVKKAFNIKE